MKCLHVTTAAPDENQGSNRNVNRKRITQLTMVVNNVYNTPKTANVVVANKALK